MKKYNIENYNIYKKDLNASIKNIGKKEWQDYTRQELIIIFLPLVENLARKFSTSTQAIGIMSLKDMLQDGSIGLARAVDKIIWDRILNSPHPEKTVKSFLSKRIKGAIRRGADNNRGTMRIPEHKINEIRKNDDESKTQVFFNAVFSSLDELNENGNYFDPQEQIEINNETQNNYLMFILNKYLNQKEKDVLRYSYGLDCDKLSAKQIAEKIGIKGDSAYVRVSQLKKQAIDKLRECADYSQVIDYL